MLADTAVAVNLNDERYHDLVGMHAILPLVGRRLPVIAEEHVDPEFGTGALKITPGHDPNDFEIGRAHNLPEISVIGEDGRITDEAPERFRGMTAVEAHQAVVAELREQGLIRGEEPYTHSVPFSHRSGQRIEPLISLQWFCRMDEMALRAIDVVTDGRVRFIPAEPHTKVYLDWMERIRPWCISRALLVGPAPASGTGATKRTSASIPLRARDGNRRRTSSTPGSPRRSGCMAPWGGLTLKPPNSRHFFRQTSLSRRGTSSFWVARMIMTSLEFTDEILFSDVYVHSVIQAPDGRRMSKSLGTGIDPLDEIEEHGADALRFGLLAMSSTQDVRLGRVSAGADLANKTWNASRLIS